MEVESFINSLHGDLAHRKKELARIKLDIQDSHEEDILEWMARAAAVLTYAHWEGFIKGTSIKYVKFINGQNVPTLTLKSCFQAAVVVSHFKQAEGTSKTGHLAKLLVAMDERRSDSFKVNPHKIIDTEHNLSSTVFLALLESIGLEPLPSFATKVGFIDATLILARNQVAHGELVSITPPEAVQRIDGVSSLLDAYADQVIDAVVQQTYLAST